MFISCLNASTLILDSWCWAGDAIVRHTDGTQEIVRDAIIKNARESGYGVKCAFPPKPKRRRPVKQCPVGAPYHDPDAGCNHKRK